MSSQVAEAEKKNDFSGLGFDPTDRELEIFNKEKMNMYKGTFIVCLVYAISAIVLLGIIFWTDWGREYIYKKMLPASVTFIIGALFIIIFLVISIYELKPRRVKNNLEKDQEIVCPDFWVLKRVEDDVKMDLAKNNTKNYPTYIKNGNDDIIAGIKSKNDEALKYKCELDPSVYGDLKTYAEMKNNLYNGKNAMYKLGIKSTDSSITSNNGFIYIEKQHAANNTDSAIIPYTDNILGNYAQFAGMYVSGTKDTSGQYLGTSIFKENRIHYYSNITPNTIVPLDIGLSTLEYYYDTKPLICNVVYPQVLAKMDKDTPEQNKYRCEYAKACDIAWSDIGCQYVPP